MKKLEKKTNKIRLIDIVNNRGSNKKRTYNNQASEGVPVGCFPPPNFLFILIKYF